MSLTIFKNTCISTSRAREAFIVPASEGLLALHMPGGSTSAERETYALRNYAPAYPSPATVSGSPVFGTDHIAMDQSTRLTHSAFSEPASCSFFWVGKVDETNLTSTDNDPHLIGWGGDGQGAMLLANTPDSYHVGGLVPLVESGFTGPTITADHSAVQMIAGTIEDGVGMTIYNLTAGTSNTIAYTDPRGTGVGAEKLHLGGQFSGSTPSGGAHSTYMAAAWNVALSATQVSDMATWFRAVSSDINGGAAGF